MYQSASVCGMCHCASHERTLRVAYIVLAKRNSVREVSVCSVYCVPVEGNSVREVPVCNVCSDVPVKRTVWTSQSLCVVRIVWDLGADGPGADDLSLVLMTLVV